MVGWYVCVCVCQVGKVQVGTGQVGQIKSGEVKSSCDNFSLERSSLDMSSWDMSSWDRLSSNLGISNCVHQKLTFPHMRGVWRGAKFAYAILKQPLMCLVFLLQQICCLCQAPPPWWPVQQCIIFDQSEGYKSSHTQRQTQIDTESTFWQTQLFGKEPTNIVYGISIIIKFILFYVQ